MALLGLFLLPLDYRAGAETAHAHSLVQTWADAADGAILHHQVGASHQHHGAINWLDPEVENPRGVALSAAAADPDFAGQHESAPVSSGVHFLVDAVVVILVAAVSRAPLATSVRHLTGWTPRVLPPPPRWTAPTT